MEVEEGCQTGKKTLTGCKAAGYLCAFIWVSKKVLLKGKKLQCLVFSFAFLLL